MPQPLYKKVEGVPELTQARRTILGQRLLHLSRITQLPHDYIPNELPVLRRSLATGQDFHQLLLEKVRQRTQK